MSEFGKLLRAARKCKDGGNGWSLNQLSKRVEWSDTTITRWEDGTLPPPGPEAVMALAKVLTIDPKPLMRAALATRGNMTLEVTEDKVPFAASLAVYWSTLSQLTVEKLAKVLSEAPK